MLKFLLLPVFLFLSACGTVSPPTPTIERPYYPQIDLSGRLSVQYQRISKPQAIHINFNWSQTSQQTMITLTSPTGQTLAKLQIDAQGAQLKQADKPTQFASDADQLMSTTLGWPLPVAGLRDWLQGFMDDKHQVALSPAKLTNDTYLIIDGWNLTYPAWDVENHIERPKQLLLQRQTEQAGLVKIRIVIDEWNPK